MKLLKVVRYKPRVIQTWQMLIVVGDTKEQVRERTMKSFNSEEDFEFKDYSLVEVSDSFEDKIKNTDNKTAKNMAEDAVESIEPQYAENLDDLKFEKSSSERQTP